MKNLKLTEDLRNRIAVNHPEFEDFYKASKSILEVMLILIVDDLEYLFNNFNMQKDYNSIEILTTYHESSKPIYKMCNFIEPNIVLFDMKLYLARAWWETDDFCDSMYDIIIPELAKFIRYQNYRMLCIEDYYDKKEEDKDIKKFMISLRDHRVIEKTIDDIGHAYIYSLY